MVILSNALGDTQQKRLQLYVNGTIEEDSGSYEITNRVPTDPRSNKQII